MGFVSEQNTKKGVENAWRGTHSRGALTGPWLAGPWLPAVCLLLTSGLLGLAANAQGPKSRINQPIDESVRMTLHGSRPPRARASDDVGAVNPNEKISGISLLFTRSEAQQADLDGLLVAQQDPASPLFHQWLTPEQFGVRFGMSDADLAKVEAWLQSQGFSVDAVARGRDRITFSGTAGQVASAFGAPLHYFQSGAERHFAPTADLSFPAALAPTVAGVRNLSSFHPKPRIKLPARATVKPNFTSSQTGIYHLTPADVATVYDIAPAYNAGYTGTGQSIAVVGQSAIITSDIANFQTAAGLTVKAPTQVLVPQSGTSTLYTSDESESDIDLEYSGAIAKGATIYFVYTGNNQNYGVFDALNYAIDNKIAPVISDSYGECEPEMAASDFASMNAMLAQAAAQGQTVVAADGDQGSEDCYSENNLTTAQMEQVSVDFPASSQYVTGVGGTEFPAADVVVPSPAYWTSASGTDVISSALSYIPEQVWNDDSAADGLSAGGGGVSMYAPRPSWQTGVTGIAAGANRLVPDVSFSSSPNNAGYLYCSSDSQYTGISGSCSNGFRDVNNLNLTIGGGTSFAAPIFAGMVAIINQVRYPSGQGVVNSTLYSLASNPSTYASAFHDITSGGNNCTAGVGYCSTAGAAVYQATAGYDEASGLGSVDFSNLLAAWPSSTGTTLAASTTSITAATLTPALNAADTITITVAPGAGTLTTTPTGTINLTVDGSVVNGSLALSGGAATYTFSSGTSGAHVIVATYSGNSVYSTSSATITLTIPAAAPSGSFTVQATGLSLIAGSTGTSTVTVTPSSGYTGSIAWTLTASPALSNSCFNIANVTVSGTSSATTGLTIYTSSSACTSAEMPLMGKGRRQIAAAREQGAFESRGRNGVNQHPSLRLAGMLAGVLFAGWMGRRSRKLRPLLGLALLAIIGVGLSGCGESSSTINTTPTSSNATPGTYTLTLTGTDTSKSTITASTTFTLTVN